MPDPHALSTSPVRLLLGGLLAALLTMTVWAPVASPAQAQGVSAPAQEAPPEQAVIRSGAPLRERPEINRLSIGRELGCRMPLTTLRATRAAKIPYYVGCAFLQQETGGGRNVFGHDPSVFSGAGKVTKAKYLRYKAVRERTGQMQGVGPMQLTWHTFQDRADRLGGAWKPYVNMLVGFRHLADLHDDHGSWRAAARAYNGSGPMAHEYAAEMGRRLDAGRRAIA